MCILPLVIHRYWRDYSGSRDQRYQRRKCRAFARGAFDLDGTAVAGDDAVTDRQTESGSHALGLGGKERFKDPLQVFRPDAASRIADFHKHHFVLHAGSNSNFAPATTDRLRRIHEQVRPYLVELAGEAMD